MYRDFRNDAFCDLYNLLKVEVDTKRLPVFLFSGAFTLTDALRSHPGTPTFLPASGNQIASSLLQYYE